MKCFYVDDEVVGIIETENGAAKVIYVQRDDAPPSLPRLVERGLNEGMLELRPIGPEEWLVVAS